MTKKQIKQLVQESYMDDQLNEKKVLLIAQSLSRHDLKQYIKDLRKLEKQRNVVVLLPQESLKEEEQTLQDLFPDKHLKFKIDPSLILGVKIVNNDIISEFNLKNTLEKLKEHLIKQYD